MTRWAHFGNKSCHTEVASHLSETREVWEVRITKTYNSALRYQQQGRTDKAHQLYLELIKELSLQVHRLKPTLVRVRFLARKNLGCIEEGKGKLSDALYYFVEATKDDSDDFVLWVCIGRVSVALDRFSLARFAFSQGLRISPSNVRCLFGLAEVLSTVDCIQASLKIVERLLRIQPSHTQALLLKANLLERFFNLPNLIGGNRYCNNYNDHVIAAIKSNIGHSLSDNEMNSLQNALSRTRELHISKQRDFLKSLSAETRNYEANMNSNITKLIFDLHAKLNVGDWKSLGKALLFGIKYLNKKSFDENKLSKKLWKKSLKRQQELVRSRIYRTEGWVGYGFLNNPKINLVKNSAAEISIGFSNVEICVPSDGLVITHSPVLFISSYVSALLGVEIELFWPGDENWYPGVVLRFDPKTQSHEVFYRNGDVEKILLKPANMGKSWRYLGDAMLTHEEGEESSRASNERHEVVESSGDNENESSLRRTSKRVQKRLENVVSKVINIDFLHSLLQFVGVENEEGLKSRDVEMEVEFKRGKKANETDKLMDKSVQCESSAKNSLPPESLNPIQFSKQVAQESALHRASLFATTSQVEHPDQYNSVQSFIQEAFYLLSLQNNVSERDRVISIVRHYLNSLSLSSSDENRGYTSNIATDSARKRQAKAKFGLEYTSLSALLESQPFEGCSSSNCSFHNELLQAKNNRSAFGQISPLQRNASDVRGVPWPVLRSKTMQRLIVALHGKLCCLLQSMTMPNITKNTSARIVGECEAPSHLQFDSDEEINYEERDEEGGELPTTSVYTCDFDGEVGLSTDATVLVAEALFLYQQRCRVSEMLERVLHRLDLAWNGPIQLVASRTGDNKFRDWTLRLRVCWLRGMVNIINEDAIRAVHYFRNCQILFLTLCRQDAEVSGLLGDINLRKVEKMLLGLKSQCILTQARQLYAEVEGHCGEKKNSSAALGVFDALAQRYIIWKEGSCNRIISKVRYEEELFLEWQQSRGRIDIVKMFCHVSCCIGRYANALSFVTIVLNLFLQQQWAVQVFFPNRKRKHVDIDCENIDASKEATNDTLPFDIECNSPRLEFVCVLARSALYILEEEVSKKQRTELYKNSVFWALIPKLTRVAMLKFSITLLDITAELLQQAEDVRQLSITAFSNAFCLFEDDSMSKLSHMAATHFLFCSALHRLHNILLCPRAIKESAVNAKRSFVIHILKRAAKHAEHSRLLLQKGLADKKTNEHMFCNCVTAFVVVACSCLPQDQLPDAKILALFTFVNDSFLAYKVSRKNCHSLLKFALERLRVIETKKLLSFACDEVIADFYDSLYGIRISSHIPNISLQESIVLPSAISEKEAVDMFRFLCKDNRRRLMKMEKADSRVTLNLLFNVISRPPMVALPDDRYTNDPVAAWLMSGDFLDLEKFSGEWEGYTIPEEPTRSENLMLLTVREELYELFASNRELYALKDEIDNCETGYLKELESIAQLYRWNARYKPRDATAWFNVACKMRDLFHFSIDAFLHYRQLSGKTSGQNCTRVDRSTISSSKTFNVMGRNNDVLHIAVETLPGECIGLRFAFAFINSADIRCGAKVVGASENLGKLTSSSKLLNGMRLVAVGSVDTLSLPFSDIAKMLKSVGRKEFFFATIPRVGNVGASLDIGQNNSTYNSRIALKLSPREIAESADVQWYCALRSFKHAFEIHRKSGNKDDKFAVSALQQIGDLLYCRLQSANFNALEDVLEADKSLSRFRFRVARMALRYYEESLNFVSSDQSMEAAHANFMSGKLIRKMGGIASQYLTCFAKAAKCASSSSLTDRLSFSRETLYRLHASRLKAIFEGESIEVIEESSPQMRASKILFCESCRKRVSTASKILCKSCNFSFHRECIVSNGCPVCGTFAQRKDLHFRRFLELRKSINVMQEILENEQFHHRSRHALAVALRDGIEIASAADAPECILRGFGISKAVEVIVPLFTRSRLRQVVGVWITETSLPGLFQLDQHQTKYDYHRCKLVLCIIELLKEAKDLTQLEVLKNLVKNHMQADGNKEMRMRWLAKILLSISELLREFCIKSESGSATWFSQVRRIYLALITVMSVPLHENSTIRAIETCLVDAMRPLSQKTQSMSGFNFSQEIELSLAFCEKTWPELRRKLSRKRLSLNFARRKKKRKGCTESTSPPQKKRKREKF
eukprot:g5119.t1